MSGNYNIKSVKMKKFNDTGRKCIWVSSRGKRCNCEAKGRFFCDRHGQLARNIDSCSFSENDFVVVR